VTTPRQAEERQKTLRTLLELAGGFSPSDCWDDQRAMDLLRSQSTVEELRALGASDGIIAHIFGEGGRG
jgi:protein involved in polysaccharide export with SLBB domain